MTSLQPTLQSPYSREVWTGLLRTLFSSSAELFLKPVPIVYAGCEGVFMQVLHLGDLKTADGKVAALLDIEVVPEISLSRNRAGIRHLAARLIDGVQRQAILAAFHNVAAPDWRFSFIIREKTFDIDTGEIRTTETPACRFTYLLGPNEKCRTAAERFATLSGKSSTLQDIEAAFKVDQLTKEFYSELSDWYFWALTRVRFPDDDEKNEEKRNATMTIRLITRLIFVWFLKKKGIIPESLFDKPTVDEWLNDTDTTGSTYYKAVLQNLFFATLNFDPKEGERGFVEWGKKGVLGYRYHRFFKDGAAEKFLEICKDIPFLNGGLFENLDKQTETPNPVRIDCFSNIKANESRLAVPDELFFAQEQIVNLSAFYDDKRKAAVKVKGLFEILNAYNFTVEENTPYDKDVALDPELLGQVFENLLASYNPETKATARKQTGSFYTPREIVQYMVDESIIAHLKQTVGADLEPEYRKLTRYGDDETNLSDKQKSQIVQALTTCRILDPACGSGAFPMGILQQLVHILNRLDPDNRHLKIEAIKQIREEVNLLGDEADNINENIEKMQETLKLFDETATRPDYIRKLLLIENSIYGVDIQPVAVQISKLRFFISLVVEQNPKEKIRPLPNLETNFVAANTLISIDKPELLTDDLQIKTIEKELKANRHRRFFARSTSVKKKCEREDKRLREKLKDRLVGLVSSIDQDTIDTNLSLIETFREERAKYSHEVWQVREEPTQTDFLSDPGTEQQKLPLQIDANKEKRDNIDAGIRACEARIEKEYAKANNNTFTQEAEKLAEWDPYDQNASSEFFDPEWMFSIPNGFDIVIGNPPYVQIQKLPQKDKEVLATQNYKTFSKTADLYCLFYERGGKLLSSTGSLCYITSNKFFRAGYGEPLRNLLTSEYALNVLIDFGELPVFEAGTDPVIVQFGKTKRSSFIVATIKDPADIQRLPKAVEALSCVRKSSEFSKDGWSLASQESALIVEKMRSAGTTLGTYVNNQIYYGIKTGFNQAYILDDSERDNLISVDPKSAEIIKPLAKGDDVRKWHVRNKKRWIILSKIGVDIKRYPAIFMHLKQWKDKLKARHDQGQHWWELRACVYYDIFEKSKIVYPEIARESRFTLDGSGVFPLKTIFSIPSSDKFLLGVLNSKAGWHFLKNTCSSLGDPEKGGRLLMQAIYLEKFPIPDATSEQQATITHLVDRILAVKSADPAADVTAFEAEIDRHVYALYHLTTPEIEIVEGK